VKSAVKKGIWYENKKRGLTTDYADYADENRKRLSVKSVKSAVRIPA
jgi:hypothetical protein